MSGPALMSFDRLKPTNDAVQFRCGDRILVLSKILAVNVPVNTKAEITSPFMLRMILQGNVNTSWEEANLKFAYEHLIAFQSIANFNPQQTIENLIWGLGSKFRAFMLDDERDTSGAAAPQFAADTTLIHPVAGSNVATMAVEDRLMEALQRAPSFMDEAAAAEFKQLLQPQAIAMIVASLVAVAVVAATGIGGAIVLAVGWACVGWAIFDAAGHFYDFFTTINNASSDEDLDKAAEMLARAVVALGIGALMAFLTKALHALQQRVARKYGKLLKRPQSVVARGKQIQRMALVVQSQLSQKLVYLMNQI